MRRERALATLDDAELLSMVRRGESKAYSELWHRHTRSAHRVADRLAPGRAEDLVSETYLAVYHQLTVAGNGPESAFRAYFFATMRNTATRWGKEASLVTNDPILDEVDPTDALSTIEDAEQSTEVLEAFKALPERWQRVLWLTEVEETKRSKIAAEFGITPNAVSVLYRRARSGLRLQWLLGQVPVHLHDTPEHAARLLPELVVSRKSLASHPTISAHLKICETCAEVYADLRNAHIRMNPTALSIAGLIALGLTFPFKPAPMAAAASAGSAAVGTTSTGFATIAASVTAIAASGAIITGAVLFVPTESAGSATPPQSAVSEPWHGSEHEPLATLPPERADDAEREGDADRLPRPPLGRGNDDHTLPGHDVGVGREPNDFYIPPAQPVSVPPTSIPQPAPSGIADPKALSSGLATHEANGYLAPILTGTTAPGAQIAIELLERVSNLEPMYFTVQPDATGQWTFDLRTVTSTRPGNYEYQVWAFTDTEVSAADSGTFSLSPAEVAGFESLTSPLLVAEASTTGIVFEARGPAGGTICLSSVYSGQAAEISLDDSGIAIQRIRFLTGGTYLLNFRTCEGEQRGPENLVFVDVEDPNGPIFGPFGPDPSQAVFELSSP